jgi:glycosyltransferase involved in cell wall biosynthesis
MGAVTTPNQPTRLLMLSHYFDTHRGGIEIVAAALARELAALGLEVAWLATGETDETIAASQSPKRSLAASNAVESILGLPYPILFPAAWRTIFAEARRADVIMAHDALYMTSIIGYLAARVRRKPFLVVQHIGHVPYRNFFLRTLMTAANRLVAMPILRRAEKVVFISEITKLYFARIRWRQSPAIVFNGVDTHIFFPAVDDVKIAGARRSLALPAEGPIALFVGRFVEKKGLQVLERMARSRSDICFAFAGWGALDPTSWRLPNVCVYTNLSGSSLANLYRASDVLLLPSSGEGFPLVVQEALACGLPIICGTDTAQADSRAAPFVEGVEVDQKDLDRTACSFAEAMTRSLARLVTPADRMKSFEFAKCHYSWRASATCYASLLRDLVPCGADMN